MSLPTADFDFNTDFNTDARARPLPTAAGERLDTCPWCDQAIPPEKLAEISGRMAAREHDLVAGASVRLREEFARERSLADAKARSALEQVRREAAIEMERGRQAALTGLQTKLAEAEAARRMVEREMQALKTSQEAEVLRRVQEARATFERDRVSATLAEQARTLEERQRLQNKVHELQRQLESKTAQELGEGAHINLYEALRTTFRGDRIVRQSKNQPFGADLVQEVFHNGKLCGKIVYDSKNRGFWRHEYVLRLREDRIALRAEHAVLSSNKFPAGAHQLHIQDGVIIANPARILAIAGLLRTHLVQLQELQVSNEARGEKTNALYTFMTSERCRQLLDMIDSLTQKVLEVDLAEQKAHTSVWDKRSRLLKAVLKAHGDLCIEIDRIIGTAAASTGGGDPGQPLSEF